MHTEENFNTNEKKEEPILNDVTKHDNSLQRLFNMINKFNAETSQYVIVII